MDPKLVVYLMIVVSILAIVSAFVMAILGIVSGAQALDLMKWVVIAVIGGKAVVGGTSNIADAMRGRLDS
jgi:hypothetical protein